MATKTPADSQAAEQPGASDSSGALTEQAMVEQLFALIRELHGKKQAEELVKTFEGAFGTHESEGERRSVIEYWWDFYRLRKYRRQKQRRRPKYKERMSPCSACGYPVSHRHHLWDIQMHGENEVTIQLCANCHELQHLFYNALVRDSAYSQRLAQHALFSGKITKQRAQLVLDWCKATIRYESKNGWVEDWRATDEWAEGRLRWAEFLTKAPSEV